MQSWCVRTPRPETSNANRLTLRLEFRVTPLQTPTQLLSLSASRASQRPRVSLDASPGDVDHDDTEQHQFQLVVQPLVKYTVEGRDTSATILDVFAAHGATFSDIIHKLWEQFCSCIKGFALKQNGVWSIETPTEASWYKAM
ncbi:hypothetical protein PHMEG_00036621 [Phytophthora megakarya]|uniref:Uncharacterized protein n=1 Tax=Phytophthora megakarya TaxID=4795 RepID=A0A225ULN0_9STRA|nr:hypothetical protein PHMEG_00036621 [Phytophthora megakarya]